MGKNVVTKEFLASDTWTAPAGVQHVRVRAVVYVATPTFGIGGTTSIRAYGIDALGQLYAWGDNSNLLGNTAGSSPVAISGLPFTPAAVLPGNGTIFLDNDGNAWGLGSNTVGMLGNGDTTARSTPTAVIGGLRFRMLANDTNNGPTIGITRDGDAYAWGAGSSGQLGDGTAASKSSPVALVGGLKWRTISVASNRAYGVAANGDGYAWGDNANGCLGVGDVVDRSSPTLILGGVKWRQIAGQHSTSRSAVGLDEARRIWTWGTNAAGIWGTNNPTVTDQRSSPVMVESTRKWAKILVTSGSAFALTTDGDLWAWGSNSNGILGVGDVAARSTPTAVVGGLRFLDMFSANSGMLGLASDGNLYGWGTNSDGQLAVGDATMRSSPTLVVGSVKWAAMREAIVNDLLLPVVPGESYAVTVFGSLASFGAFPVFRDQSTDGILPVKIQLSYEA